MPSTLGKKPKDSDFPAVIPSSGCTTSRCKRTAGVPSVSKTLANYAPFFCAAEQRAPSEQHARDRTGCRGAPGSSFDEAFKLYSGAVPLALVLTSERAQGRPLAGRFRPRLHPTVAAFAQACRRKMQRRSIFPNGHAAAVHRFDLHCPERLNSAVAHIRAVANCAARNVRKPWPSGQKKRAPLRIPPDILRAYGNIFAREVLPPAVECVRRHAMLVATVLCAESRSVPRFDANTPPGLSRRVLEVSQNPPEILHAPREHDMSLECTTQTVRETGHAQATGRWQDKRAHIARRSVGCFC